MRRTAKQKSPTALEALPQAAGEVWEGGIGTLSAELRDEESGELQHPELAMWVSAENGFILAYHLVSAGSGATALLDLLLEAMRRPVVGKPRRPGTVRVTDPRTVPSLQEALTPLNVAVESGETLDHWQTAFDQADAVVAPAGGGYHPATAEHAESLAGLFRAAAAFYRAEPWRLLDDGNPLGLDVPAMPGVSLGMSVMGAGGENRGLVVYPSLAAMLEFYQVATKADFASLDPADLPPSIALNFAAADEMPGDSVEEVQARGWELAAPDAYPLLLATAPGEGCFLDLSPEPLTLMTIALQAVTRFWAEAEAELRAGQLPVVREVEIEFAGSPVPVRVSCPPTDPGPRRRSRKPALGPRQR